jgi:hypothetical protein
MPWLDIEAEIGPGPAAPAFMRFSGGYSARRGLGRIRGAASDLGAVHALATGGSMESRTFRPAMGMIK